jgi:hypothetical protein
VNRLFSRIGVRVASVGLLVVGAAGGVYLGQDRDVRPRETAAVQPVLRAESDELQLLKQRQNAHAAARAWQREAENEAAGKAAAEAKSAASRARTLEKKVVEAKAKAKAGDSGDGPDVPYNGPIPGSCKEFSGNRATGCALTLEAGFGIAEFPCLNNLWNKESGWNARAKNKSSGAYGIPQAYPGDKMASVASDWRTNPATQIKWGLGYIKGRFDSPCGAWSHWQSSGSY